METYWSDLIKTWEGEVAEVQGEWEYSEESMPRNKALWHHQFALSQTQYWDLYQLKAHTAVGDELLPDTCDVESFGGTTVLCRHAQGGHWRRKAHVTVLAKLFWDLGDQYTAQELLFWWIHAKKTVKKRDHPTGSPERIEAAALRKKEWGKPWPLTYERPHSAVGDTSEFGDPRI